MMIPDSEIKKLANDILDLCSFKYKPRHATKEERWGHDTSLEGCEEEACELIKKFLARNSYRMPTEEPTKRSPYAGW